MWECPKCGRLFEKKAQAHSCQKIPVEQHFIGKDRSKEIFDYLYQEINEKVGSCKIVSLPCCIHLYGKYDFLAALPKKDRLEIRFALERAINSPRLIQSVPLSSVSYKNCVNVNSIDDIDRELIDWLIESYHLKDKKT